MLTLAYAPDCSTWAESPAVFLQLQQQFSLNGNSLLLQMLQLTNVGKKELVWEIRCSGSGMSGLQSLLRLEPFHLGLRVAQANVDLGDTGIVCLAGPWFLRTSNMSHFFPLVFCLETKLHCNPG